MIDDFAPAFSPQMWLLIAVAVLPVLLWSGRHLLVLNRRERAQQRRLEVFRGPVIQQTTSPSLFEQLGNFLSPIIGAAEQQRLLKLMTAAGLKQPRVSVFIAAKAISALSIANLIWLSPTPQSTLLRVIFFGVALLMGWKAPDTVMNQRVKRRRLRLEKGMPDALDLLVICAEAGLSLNQSVDEVSRRMILSNKDVADEFGTTSAEMRVLPDFGTALDNLVDRTGLVHLRGLIATLKQTLQFGTPLAESLRVIAAEMRAERTAKMEERAARLPVLLAIPLMMFILPCLFMIIGTPVALRIMDVFKTIHIGAFGIH